MAERRITLERKNGRMVCARKSLSGIQIQRLERECEERTNGLHFNHLTEKRIEKITISGPKVSFGFSALLYGERVWVEGEKFETKIYIEPKKAKNNGLRLFE